MNQHDLMPVLQSVKVLADENRLRMIGYLSNQEHNVGELADLLGLTEPTISHHLTRLRDAILDLNTRITESRNTNALLLNRSREYISRIMDMLARLHTPGGTYDRRGTAGPKNAALAVDRRI